MPIYSPTGYLDITNATLRTSNTECENLLIRSGNIYVTTELDSDAKLDLESVVILGNTTSNTIRITNATTGLISTGNVHALKFIGDGSLLTGVVDNNSNISNIEVNLEDNSYRIYELERDVANIVVTSNLQQILDLGNVTSNTIQITNETTGLITSGNVEALKFIGDGSLLTGISSNLQQVLSFGNSTTSSLITSGNVEATKFIGDGSLLTGISSNLQQVISFGNTASSTMNLTNPVTSLVTNGDVRVGGTITMGTINLVSTHSLSAVTNTGNVASATVEFRNEHTALVASGNVEIGKSILTSGDIRVNGDAEFYSNLNVSGYTKSGNPVFYAYKSSPGITRNSYIFYDATRVNIGNHMNTLSGIFTCPIDGIYTFTWGARGNYTDIVSRYHIHKNNIQIDDTFISLGNMNMGVVHDNGEMSVILDLIENDMISISYNDDTDLNNTDYGPEYTYFQGHLISYT